MNVLWAVGSSVRHSVKVLAEGLLLLAILGALVLGAALLGGSSPSGADSALAARGGNGGGGAALWIETSTARDSDGSLRFGGEVAFGYRSDTAQSIQLQCFVDGGLVFADARMLFEGGAGYGEPFALGPSVSWTAGAADCTASLGHRARNGRYVVEASMGFAVAP
jgi:hypothetical protein